jgi:hypothetical protein
MLIHCFAKPGGPFGCSLITLGAIFVELLALRARRPHVAHEFAAPDLFVDINICHVLPHRFNKIYRKTCAPSLFGLDHLLLLFDLRLFEKAVAFGGAGAPRGMFLKSTGRA